MPTIQWYIQRDTLQKICSIRGLPYEKKLRIHEQWSYKRNSLRGRYKS